VQIEQIAIFNAQLVADPDNRLQGFNLMLKAPKISHCDVRLTKARERMSHFYNAQAMKFREFNCQSEWAQ